MEINKKVLQELIKEVKGRRNSAKKIYVDYLTALRDSKSVEEIVKVKQDFFLGLINNLPVIKEDDYFCLLYYDEAFNHTCFDCPYGKIHGNCQVSGSDYDVMYDFICDLRAQIIHKFFKKGEKYG